MILPCSSLRVVSNLFQVFSIATPTANPIPSPTPITPQNVIPGLDVVTIQTRGIQRLAPKRYDRKGQPAKLYDWIRKIDKIVELLETPDGMKVNLATH